MSADSWQDRFRELGERLTAGLISTDDYRRQSAEILAEADREAAERTRRERLHIPTSAAWEAPSGEMTQIVGTRDETTVVAGARSPVRAADATASTGADQTENESGNRAKN